MLCFDEFSVCKRPNTSYAWAIKNTRPQVKSTEGDRSRLNRLLTIDVLTGENHIKLIKQAKTEDLVDYFYELMLDLTLHNPHNKYKICTKISVVLDNNSTHKDKMKKLLKFRLAEFEEENRLQGSEIKLPKIEFIHTAAYSPDYNLAEYGIRIIRQKYLHHLPHNEGLDEIEARLEYLIQTEGILTKQGVKNVIRHILDLGMGRG